MYVNKCPAQRWLPVSLIAMSVLVLLKVGWDGVKKQIVKLK